MGRKRKYCLNFTIGSHQIDKESKSTCYCSNCYDAAKKRYDNMQKMGGELVGLRAARTLAGGSFGYETRMVDKKRNLMAFFNYVMPHIPIERAIYLTDKICEGKNTIELESHDGYKTVLTCL